MIKGFLVRRLMMGGEQAFRAAVGPCLALALVVAVAVTALTASLGYDAAINALARRQNRWASIGWSAFPMIAGLVAPVAVPAWLWRQTSLRALAGPTFGAVVVAITTNLTLKVVTGRASPEAPFPTDLLARSQSFAFGIARGGIVEGWPSGHAMTNVAMATALIALTPDLRVRAAATGWAAWVVAAVIFGISGDVHWMSDGVAGALLGCAVGWRVARFGAGAPRSDKKRSAG